MEDIEGRLGMLEEKAKSHSRRLDKVEEQQESLNKLISSVEVLATRQETVESDVKEIKADVKGLTEKPGRRWEAMADKAIWAVLAALLGFLLAQAGL